MKVVLLLKKPEEEVGPPAIYKYLNDLFLLYYI
jgi:hypothetical protein